MKSGYNKFLEVEMKKFIWCAIILAVVPMLFLNSMGRDAFLGYYLGLIIMWLVAIMLKLSNEGA